MNKANELAYEFPEQNLLNLEHDAVTKLNGWGIKAVDMLRSQAKEIEQLKKERDALKAALRWQPASGMLERIEALSNENLALKADAERYRWLKDNRSYAYAMQPDSPAECGIEYQWQQGSYEERDWNIDSAIDDEISRAAIDAMKGET